MKEMTNVASAVMTEEEKAEMERNIKSQGGATTPNIEHKSTAAAAAAAYTGPENPTASPPGPTSEPKPFHPTAAASESVPPSPAPGASSPQGLSPSTSPGAAASTDDLQRKKKGKQKLTPEQKQKLEEIEKERRQAMEKRVKTLTDKLIERIRPFVDAEHPGDPNDPETIAFQDKMKREAEDLKFESFGVEVSYSYLQNDSYLRSATSCYTQLGMST